MSGSTDVNSCEVIVDDLFNMDIKMKHVQGLSQDMGSAAQLSQSMRAIPTFNHAKVKKTISKEK